MTGMDFIRVLALVWLAPPFMASEPHPTRRLLARRLRVLRATHGWSQETLAALSGLHRTYIRPLSRILRCTGICECPERQDAERDRFGRSRRPVLSREGRMLRAHGCA